MNVQSHKPPLAALDAQHGAQFLQSCTAASLDERVAFELRDRVLWLVIQRADKHNALALDMLDSMARILRLAAAQLAESASPDWLRLAVVSGSGTESFAAGGDLKELDAVRSHTQTQSMTQRGLAALNAIRDFPQPVIAGLNGTARGGGAELAMACDLRIAHQGAAIGFIQGRLNLSPAWGGGTDLMQRLGASAALRVLAEAAVVNAAEAQARGLFDLVLPVAATDFAEALAAYVATLAQRPAQVLRAHKTLAIATAAAADRAQLQALESELLVRTWTHADHWSAAAQALKK